MKSVLKASQRTARNLNMKIIILGGINPITLSMPMPIFLEATGKRMILDLDITRIMMSSRGKNYGFGVCHNKV